MRMGWSHNFISCPSGSKEKWRYLKKTTSFIKNTPPTTWLFWCARSCRRTAFLNNSIKLMPIITQSNRLIRRKEKTLKQWRTIWINFIKLAHSVKFNISPITIFNCRAYSMFESEILNKQKHLKLKMLKIFQTLSLSLSLRTKRMRNKKIRK